jgi:hypothetical protein
MSNLANALDFRQEEFKGSSAQEARLYDNALVSHGHFRGLPGQITKKDEQARKDQKEEPYYCAISHEQQRQTPQPEKRGEENGPKEYDPVKSGLVEHLFTGNEIAFDVAHVVFASVVHCMAWLQRRPYPGANLVAK